MPPNRRVRFRLWHLFALVAIASIGVWSFSQFGIETAEIEIVEATTFARNVDSYEDSFDANTNGPDEVISVVFRFVRPKDMSDTRVNLFWSEPIKNARGIESGDRIKFRYRTRPFLWLRPGDPTSIAIRSIGLDQNRIEQIISEIGMPEEDE